MVTADENAPTNATSTDYVGRVENGYSFDNTGWTKIGGSGDAAADMKSLKDWLKNPTTNAYLASDITYNWDDENVEPYLAPADSEIGAGVTLDGCGYKITFKGTKFIDKGLDESGNILGQGTDFAANELSTRQESWRSSYVASSKGFGSLTGVLRGTIKNLLFEVNQTGSIMFRMGDTDRQGYMGGLVGFIAEGAIVDNVAIKIKDTPRYGMFKSESASDNGCVFSYVGGLAGASKGKISNVLVQLENTRLEASAMVMLGMLVISLTKREFLLMRSLIVEVCLEEQQLERIAL